MGRVLCHQSVSLDGFSAGPNQSLENPIGEGGLRLHEWMFETAAWARMQGLPVRPETPDSAVVDDLASNANVGAFIMGRRMFGGGDGAWDESWRGWWGEDPPYHRPVFAGGSPVGYVTSASYGYSIGRTVVYAWLPGALAAPGTALAVEYFGERLPATVQAEPLFDPTMERIRR